MTPSALRAMLGAAAAIALLAGCGEDAPSARPLPAPGGERERIADVTARAKERESAGDAPGAEAAWEEVLSLRPGHASALYATARLRRGRGDRQGALARIEALRGVEPNAGRGWLLAAEILADPASGALRDLPGAEAAARAALERNPEESGPHLALGRVLLLRGRAAEAAERLEIAARMNPRDAESRSLLGAIHLRAGRTPEARRWFRAAVLGGRAPGVSTARGGVPGEGDTVAILDPERTPSAGELCAAAGLRAVGETVAGGIEGGACEGTLRAAAETALRAMGTGAASLDLDGDGTSEAAAVEVPGGGVSVAVASGKGRVTLYR